MKLKKETIELLESLLSRELVKIQRHGRDYPAYHSVRSIAKHIGELMHWNGQPEGEQFIAIMNDCLAIHREHQEQEENNQ